MKLSIDEVLFSDINDLADKNIAIRLSGEDISFQANEYSVSVYITEEQADKISYKLQEILKDRHYRRNPQEIAAKK